MNDFNWSLPAIAMVVGVGLGLVLVLTFGIWKSLPLWVKVLAALVLVVFILLLGSGRIPLPRIGG
jgi:hypothetical protein